MRRRNWLLALVLCAGMLLAMAQTVRAEPETIPDDAAVAAESDTTLQTRSTYDWELITDENGVTVYPPPPDSSMAATSEGPTTTTKKTSRTSAPFQHNPDHPDDNYTGPLSMRPLPSFVEELTDIYGNVVTETVTAKPTTTETTTEMTSEEPATQDETYYEDTLRPKSAIPWPIAAAAGAVLLAAAVGGIIVLAKGKKDDEDDYIYESE